MYDVAANLKTPNFLGTFMAGKEAAQDARLKKVQTDTAERASNLAAKRLGYGQGYAGQGDNTYAESYKPSGSDIINGTAFNSLKEPPRVAKQNFTTEGFYSAAFKDAAAAGDSEMAAQFADKLVSGKKALLDMNKSQLESAKTGLELQGQLLGGVRDQATWESALQQAQTYGMDVSQFPRQYNPATVDAMRSQALSAKDHLDQVWKGKNWDLDNKKFNYQQINDVANRGVTMRGQNLTNARAVDANNIAAQIKADGRIEGAAGVDIALDTLNTIANHPGLNSGTGSIMAPLMRNIPGTDSKGFASQVEQFKSQVFLPAVQAMKGMGQLSNAEGSALTRAIGNLDPDMPTAEFKQQALKIYSQIEAARNRKYSDIPSTDLGTAGASNAPRLGTVKNGFIFMGGNPELKSNWKQTR